jgi:hypothetical protein
LEGIVVGGEMIDCLSPLPSPASSLRARGTRARSEPVVERLQTARTAEDLPGNMRQDRQAISLRPVSVLHATPTVDVESQQVEDTPEQRLADAYQASEGRRSSRPLLSFIPIMSGKIMAAVGALSLVYGYSASHSSFNKVGYSTLIGGILLVAASMPYFFKGMWRIEKQAIPGTVVGTMVGLVLVMGGQVVAQCDQGTRSLGVHTVGAAIILAGLICINVTMPKAFAYNEIVYGDIFLLRRQNAALAIGATGIGLATGLSVARGIANDKVKVSLYPFGVPQAISALGISLVNLAAGLSATNALRAQAKYALAVTAKRQVKNENKALLQRIRLHERPTATHGWENLDLRRSERIARRAILHPDSGPGSPSSETSDC